MDYSKKKLSYLLDKAHIYRVFKKYDDCIAVLNDAHYFAEGIDQMLVESWQCFIGKEQAAFMGTIDRDSFTVAVQECFDSYNTTYQDSLMAHMGVSYDSVPEPVIPFSYTLQPNPVSEELTVVVEVEDECEIEILIVDRFGVTKYTHNLGTLSPDTYYHPINTSLYPSELYHIYLSGCGHYDSQQFMVIHPAY